jgi:poly(A) polymerase
MTASPTPDRSLRLASADWLTRQETQAVFAALAAKRHAARAVGGAVRNALLGRPVVDVDIATTARPDEVIAAAQFAGLSAVPTGIAHGTVTVIADRVPYEVTTLRRDVETHGRHATVAFTDDWAADARRRDFTINALYCGADGELFDPLGGAPDIEARRVRFIGDPRERIREDYLRILRFFRLTAEYAVGTPDVEALAACVLERDGIARLSAERVRQELLRLLVAPRGPELVRSMLDYGLLPLVFDAAPRPTLLQRLAALEAALACEPDAILRLAALAVEVPEDGDRLATHLRLSNDERVRLVRVAACAPDLGPAGSEAAARAYLYAEGAAAYRDRVLIAWARSGDAPDSQSWRARLALPERWRPPRFALGGADVMTLGVPAGPRVGELLRAVEDWWIAGDFAADAGGLRDHLQKLVTLEQNDEHN